MIGRAWLLALLVPGAASAQTVELPLDADSKVRFASAQEAAALLGRADPWIKELSPFDRSARIGQPDDPGEERFLEFAAAQAQGWSSEQIETLGAVVKSAAERIERLGLRLPLPPTVLMVRTTGAEEGSKPYTRANAIILPDSELDRPAEQMEHLFLHELFHIMSRHEPSLREPLYGVIGYRPCPGLPFPEELAALKMTNPDAFHHDSCIDVEAGGSARTVTPVLYAKGAYTEGGMFDSMVFRLMAVEESEGRWQPARDGDGLGLFEPGEVRGFFEKIGRNTRYVIHPEETMADNFVFAVVEREELPNPEIVAGMLELLRPEAKR